MFESYTMANIISSLLVWVDTEWEYQRKVDSSFSRLWNISYAIVYIITISDFHSVANKSNLCYQIWENQLCLTDRLRLGSHWEGCGWPDNWRVWLARQLKNMALHVWAKHSSVSTVITCFFVYNFICVI